MRVEHAAGDRGPMEDRNGEVLDDLSVAQDERCRFLWLIYWPASGYRPVRYVDFST